MNVSDKLKRVWEEAVVVQFQDFSGEAEEMHEIFNENSQPPG
jgi:hypothetical protein